MKIDRLPPVRTSLQPTNHPYMTGAWTPLHEEVDAVELEVLEGAIPTDLDGVYLRNTENPVHHPLGRYHPFDGDGMVHGKSGNGREKRTCARREQAVAIHEGTPQRIGWRRRTPAHAASAACAAHPGQARVKTLSAASVARRCAQRMRSRMPSSSSRLW